MENLGVKLEGYEVFFLCFLAHYLLIIIIMKLLSLSVENNSDKWWFKLLLWSLVLIYPYISKNARKKIK